jgi:hypothetical protein
MSLLETQARRPRLPERPRVSVLPPEAARKQELVRYLEQAQFYMRKWKMSEAQAVEAVVRDVGLAHYPAQTREAWKRDIMHALADLRQTPESK